jgi:hypothetical protein
MSISSIETQQNVKVCLNRAQTEELVEDWCRDLESGNHQQGKGKLRWGDKWCCLGRLLAIVKEKYSDLIDIYETPGSYQPDITLYGCGTEKTCLSVARPIREFIGFNGAKGNYIRKDGDITALSTDNDSGKTFPEIAQIIREHKAELFPILAEKVLS